MDYLQEAQVTQESSGIKTAKIFWSIFFGVIFIIIFIIVYLIFTSGNKNVSDNKLIEGVAVEVGESDVVKFNLNEEKHGMMINFVGDDSVDLTISSEPINISLKINEIKEVDLNNDGAFDIKIKLVSIIEGKATIAFQKIEKESCREHWECYDWSGCSKGYQKRECRDLNSCGSIFDRPSIIKACIEIEYVENNSAFNEEQNKNENESINNTANVLNATLPLNNSGIKLTINKSENTSLENRTNTSTNHTYINNTTDRPPSTNATNSSVNHPVNNTNTTVGGLNSTENHSTNNTSSTTGSSPCPSGTYFCNEYYGYICKTDYILSPNNPSCCSNQCLKIPSNEYLCYARGYKPFTGNETHICKVQVYTYFNATSVPCCSVIEARYNTTSTISSGGNGANTNSTNYSGLSNQI
jgi:hypothetical protein